MQQLASLINVVVFFIDILMEVYFMERNSMEGTSVSLSLSLTHSLTHSPHHPPLSLSLSGIETRLIVVLYTCVNAVMCQRCDNAQNVNLLLILHC